MTARDRLRAWDVNFFGSSNLTHKSATFLCRHGVSPIVLVPGWYSTIFYLKVRRTNGAVQKKHTVLKMRLLIFTLAHRWRIVKTSMVSDGRTVPAGWRGTLSTREFRWGGVGEKNSKSDFRDYWKWRPTSKWILQCLTTWICLKMYVKKLERLILKKKIALATPCHAIYSQKAINVRMLREHLVGIKAPSNSMKIP